MRLLRLLLPVLMLVFAAAPARAAPTITIPWDKLDAIKAETQDQFRYGF